MKRFLTLYIFLLTAITMSAQTGKTIYVWQQGNYTAMENVDSITFSLPGSEPDNPNVNPGGKTGIIKGGILDSATGLCLTAVGGSTYSYSADGTLSSILEPSDDVTLSFSYNPNQIKTAGTNFDGNYTFSTNADGCITNWAGTYTDEGDPGSEEATYEYDSDGHVVKLTYHNKYRETNSDGTVENLDEPGTVTLTWQDGLITQMIDEFESTDVVDGESSTEKYTTTCTLSYDSGYENPYHQWIPSFFDCVGIDGWGRLLAYAGLMGAGPRQLPSSIYFEEKSTDSDDESGTYVCSYSFNSDGTVAEAVTDNEKTAFTYGYVNQANSKSRAFAESKGSVARHHGMFRHARK